MSKLECENIQLKNENELFKEKFQIFIEEKKKYISKK